jgi:two-component system sensor histidine kinase MprB
VSLRRRLTLLSALAVALAIAVAAAIVYFLVRDQLRDQIDDTLRERAGAARVIAGAAPPVPPGSDFDAPAAPPGPPPEGERADGRGPSSVELPPPPGGEFVPVGQLVSADGTIEVSRGGAELPVTDETRQVAAGDRGPLFSDASVNGSELRIFTTPVEPGTALQVARPLDEVNSTLADLRLILFLVTLGGVGLAAAFGLLVARGALAPAAAVSGAAEEVARTRDLTRRIEVRGSDELARLAASFNLMMEALENSEAARRRLVADASHELRTPLATLRTGIETLARRPDLDADERGRIVGDLEAELEDLSGLVGDVVELAREPDGAAAARADVRLDEVVGAAVERARRRSRGLQFSAVLEPWLVNGDPERLDRAVWNLLDNAIKWSPNGGEVEVRLSDGELVVRDHGPGFAEADLPHAFDRFYRSDQARGKPGSGLGLAIAKRIAEQHGGIAAARNADGGGAEVTLGLPGEPLPPERV